MRTRWRSLDESIDEIPAGPSRRRAGEARIGLDTAMARLVSSRHGVGDGDDGTGGGDDGGGRPVRPAWGRYWDVHVDFRGTYRYCRWFDLPSELRGEELCPSEAARVLRGLDEYDHQFRVLEAIHRGLGLYVSRYTYVLRKRDLYLPALLSALERRSLVAVRLAPSVPPRLHDVELPQPPPPEEVVVATFDLQVVLDGDGSAVGQLALGVKAQGDASSRPHRTDSGGRIHIDYVPRGTAEVTASLAGARLDQSVVAVGWGTSPIGAEEEDEKEEPALAEPPPIRYLVVLERYKVRDGDTPQSVARRARMSWADLAYFNWGTRDAEELEHHLRFMVGSTKKGAGGRLVFSGGDQPGLVMIPRPYSKDGLATDTMNVLRVRPPRLPFARVVDAAHQPIAGKDFAVFDGGRQVYSGKSDSSGWLHAPFRWRSDLEVRFAFAGTTRSKLEGSRR